MSSALPCSSHQKYVWTSMNVVVCFISGRAGHRRVFDGVLPVTCSWISWFCLALLDSFCNQWEHVDRRIHGWDSYIHLHPVAKATRWCNRLERQSRRVEQHVGHRIWHHYLDPLDLFDRAQDGLVYFGSRVCQEDGKRFRERFPFYFGIYWQFIDIIIHINSAYCVALWSFVNVQNVDARKCGQKLVWTPMLSVVGSDMQCFQLLQHA